eukprot:CAMPEP_0119269680 /NCGR_PEP_ID=MMETSP1329-20130426/6992_1 /TAXON_ID=114041 /ORGANISM="Genus nov. species nov., Strain RCC1024" /LENGTH=328 /DNA_ID=CAMNT_0007269681 /DNA_START=180 /DNA_END=1163 /DNA_ORIENTATION=+
MQSSTKLAVAAGAAAAVAALLEWRRRKQLAAADELAMAVLSERNGRMHTAASIAAGREGGFAPRASDVFIVTYPKCGTTWVSAIAHFLRSDDDSFGEITEVIPWDILAGDCGQDLDAEQVAEPRLFKSHESYATVAKGGRYIYVARDPKDAFVSFYNFLPAYMHAPPLSVEAFAAGIFGGLSVSEGIWDHFAGWWPRRRDENVLWLCYEDIKADPPREIAKIAAFMGVDADAARVAEVAAKTTLKAMSKDGTKYDDNFVFGKIKAQMGLAADAPLRTSKVQSGKVGGGKRKLPRAVAAMLENRWAETMTSKTGLLSYQDLRATLAGKG